MNFQKISASALTTVAILVVASSTSEAITTNLSWTGDAGSAIRTNLENKDSNSDPSRGDNEPNKSRE